MGRDRAGHNRARTNHRSLAKGDSFQNDAARTEPNIFFDVDRLDHIRLGMECAVFIAPMIVIDKVTPRRNEAVVADLDAALDVKLHVVSNEDAIPDDNRRAGRPEMIVVKKNFVLQLAVSTDPHLMRPHGAACGQSRSLTDLRAAKPPDCDSPERDRTRHIDLDPPPETLEDLRQLHGVERAFPREWPGG